MAYVAELTNWNDGNNPTLHHKVDHLTCFVPGMLGIGAVNGMGVDFADIAAKVKASLSQPNPGVRGAAAKPREASQSIWEAMTATYSDVRDRNTAVAAGVRTCCCHCIRLATCRRRVLARPQAKCWSCCLTSLCLQAMSSHSCKRLLTNCWRSLQTWHTCAIRCMRRRNQAS